MARRDYQKKEKKKKSQVKQAKEFVKQRKGSILLQPGAGFGG